VLALFCSSIECQDAAVDFKTYLVPAGGLVGTSVSAGPRDVINKTSNSAKNSALAKLDPSREETLSNRAVLWFHS